jgi:hypothetical protein
MSAPAYDESRDLHDSYYAAVAELRRRFLAGQLSLADWTPSGRRASGTRPAPAARRAAPPAAAFPLAALPAATVRRAE